MQMPDFLSGHDVQRSLNLADSKCINLYPTTNDKGDITAFYSTPGLSAYTSAASIFSGLYAASNGRCFAVSGTILYEITTGGTLTNRGTVTSATVSKMSDNGIELIIVNGTDAWLFTFATNALRKISTISADFTVTIASPAVFTTVAAHGLVVGDAIQLTTTTGSNTTSGVLTKYGSVEMPLYTYHGGIVPFGDNNLYISGTINVNGGAGSTAYISQFLRDSTSGNISNLSPSYAPNGGHDVVTPPVFSPDGAFCFVGAVSVVNGGTAKIATYAVGSNGALSFVSFVDLNYTFANSVRRLTISPDGLFIYAHGVKNRAGLLIGDNYIHQFSINPATGTVTPLTPNSVTLGTTSAIWYNSDFALCISNDGKTLYAADYENNKIHYFTRTISPNTGLLSAVTSITCGTHPLDIARSTDNNNVYVTTEANGGSLEIYTRNTTTGALTLASTLLCGGATSIAISADDTNVYIGSSGTSIYEYDRNLTTGALTAMSTPIITLANAASGMYVSITPNGKSVYATGKYSSALSFHDMTIFSRQQSSLNVGLPTGLETLTTYYVIAAGLTANTFEVTLTSATSAVFTVTIASPAVFTCANHGLNIGDTVTFTTTGALPTGLATGTIYYVIAAGFTTGAFQVSATAGGTAITTTGTQSGVHTFTGGAVNTSGVQAGIHTFHTVGDGFPNGAKTVSYIDGRFVVCQPNTQNFYVSDVLAGAKWNARNVQTVDSNPDMIIGQITLHNELIVFCEQSGETFYDSGTDPSPFVRNVSGIFEVGCIAPYSIAKIDNSAMWLGRSNTGQGVIYRLNGYTPVRLSTYAIEYAIQTMTTISDAQAFTYQQEGHHFYVITFPTGGRTFAFDINTGLWHERAGWNGSVLGRWAAKEYAYFDGKHLVCDYSAGNIYSMDLSVYADGTNDKKWIRSWRAPSSEMKRVIHNKLTLEAEVGMGQNSFNAKELTHIGTDVSTGTTPFDIAISPDGNNAYVTNQNSNTISQYSISGGLLTHIGTDVATGTLPHSIVVSPDGNNVYVTNQTSNTISQYSRSGGLLTHIGIDIATGTIPLGIAISPDGNNVYVTNYNSNSVSQYSRSGGLLTHLVDIATGVGPYMIIISPDGGNAYVGNYLSSSISQYSITGGLLTHIGVDISVTAPDIIAISPDGNNVYVTQQTANTISQYSRTAGLLTHIGTDVATGIEPLGIAISPDGNNVYVTNRTSNTLSKYRRINGILTHIGTDLATGSIPYIIIISPDGNNAYVANQNSNTISQYSITLADPMISLKYSNDGGHTWSVDGWRNVSMGTSGQYAKRIYWYRLGMTTGQPRIYEVSGVGATKIVLIGAYLE